MAPLTEGTFGVDEPATAGDLLAAAYVEVGGPLDAEEAVAVFANYGLVPEGLDLEARINDTDAVSLLSALAGLFGIDWSVETSDAPITRGDLAGLLVQFESDLS